MASKSKKNEHNKINKQKNDNTRTEDNTEKDTKRQSINRAIGTRAYKSHVIKNEKKTVLKCSRNELMPILDNV